MKNNINKERIIDMLCSEDIELRKVGVNFIKSNYKTNPKECPCSQASGSLPRVPSAV